MGDGIGDSSKFGFDISKYLRDGDDDSDSGEDIKMKIINEPNESSTEIDIDEYIGGYKRDRYGSDKPSKLGIEEYISQYNVKRSNADKIEKENEAIKRLDDEIEEISKALVDNARLLDKERDLQEVLGKMMNVQKEKLMKIKEVMDDHREKEIELSKTEMKINEMLKKAQEQKIYHLKELQAVAEKHINEIDTGYDTTSRKDPYEVSDPYDVSGLGYEVKKKHRYSTDGSSGYKYIDKSKYDVVPVKKIKSIKKLKSILVS